MGGAMFRIFATFFLAGSVAGSVVAAERTFVPVASDGQIVEYQNGQIVLVTSNARAALVVSYSPESKKSGYLNLAVQNIADGSFNVSDSNVTISSEGAPLDVKSFADRVKAENRRAMWAAVGAGLAAAGNSMAAANSGYQTSYGTYSGTTNASAYGRGGYAYGTATTMGTYSSTTYNQAAAQQAQQAANANNQAMFDRQALTSQLSMQALERSALRTNTVSPGEVVGGNVQFALPKAVRKTATEFVARIDVGGEPMEVRFEERF